MKKFLNMILAVTTLVLCFTLSACGNKYVSNYTAMLMVTTNTANKASVSFDSFSGTYVMKLKNKGDASISYKASLGEGKINVYYDVQGEKLNLFEIESGNQAEKKNRKYYRQSNNLYHHRIGRKMQRGQFLI